jgi:plasmid stabilization system protein ParE
MTIFWSAAAQADLDRLHGFLAQHDPDAADAMLDRLIAAPEALLEFPRRGSRLSEFGAREVREFRVSGYLVRYELIRADIFLLRAFHAREDRFGNSGGTRS